MRRPSLELLLLVVVVWRPLLFFLRQQKQGWCLKWRTRPDGGRAVLLVVVLLTHGHAQWKVDERR